MNYYSLFPLFSFIANVILGFFIINIDSKSTKNRLFFLITVFLAFWSFTHFFMFSAENLGFATFWARLDTWGSAFTAVLLLHFFIVFTHIKLKRIHTLILAFAYLCAFIFSILDQTTHLLEKAPVLHYWGYFSPPGSLYILPTILIVGSITGGLLFLIKFYLVSKSENEKKQALFLTVAVSIPLVGGVITECMPAFFNLEVIPLSTTLSTIMAIIIGVTIRRYKLLTSTEYQLKTIEKLFNSLPDSIALVKVNGTIIKVNNAMAEDLEILVNDAIGKKMSDLLPKNVAQKRNNLLQKTVEICKMQESDDKIKNRYFHNLFIPTKSISDENNVLLISSDITERRNAEEKMKIYRSHLEQRTNELEKELIARMTAEKDLKESNINLKRSNQELEQFAYVASHDLQEPLRMVSSYTQLLKRRYSNQIDEKADKYINYAVDGARRMQNLINDLLVYSRVTTRGQLFQEVDSNDILQRTIATLEVLTQETNTTITYDKLPKVTADATQFERIFLNLIKNSIRYHGEEDPKIHISAKSDKRMCTFSVKDNGMGIDSRYKEKVFVIFQRLHKREEGSGTGLGLAICKRIVNRHGGDIWFESKDGNGTTFYFTLPLLNSENGDKFEDKKELASSISFNFKSDNLIDKEKETIDDHQ